MAVLAAATTSVGTTSRYGSLEASAWEWIVAIATSAVTPAPRTRQDRRHPDEATRNEQPLAAKRLGEPRSQPYREETG